MAIVVLCDGRKYISLLQSSGKTEMERKREGQRVRETKEEEREKECKKCEMKKDKP